MMNKIETIKMELREEMKKKIDHNIIEDMIVNRYMEYPSSTVYIHTKNIAEKLDISEMAITDNVDLILSTIIEDLHYSAVPMVDDESVVTSIEIKF